MNEHDENTPANTHDLSRHEGKRVHVICTDGHEEDGIIALIDYDLGMTVHGLNKDGTINEYDYVVCVQGPSAPQVKNWPKKDHNKCFGHWAEMAAMLDTMYESGIINVKTLVKLNEERTQIKYSPLDQFRAPRIGPDSCPFHG